MLIKPNQTVYYSAEEGCTTDPYVVGATDSVGAKRGGKIRVAESSGGFFNSIDCMRITGMAAIARARRGGAGGPGPLPDAARWPFLGGE